MRVRNMDCLKVDQLKAILRELRASPHGTKPELVARLGLILYPDDMGDETPQDPGSDTDVPAHISIKSSPSSIPDHIGMYDTGDKELKNGSMKSEEPSDVKMRSSSDPVPKIEYDYSSDDVAPPKIIKRRKLSQSSLPPPERSSRSPSPPTHDVSNHPHTHDVPNPPQCTSAVVTDRGGR
eukprot:GHVO01009427.1.p1 GENE.GHVO01009427.1~~GHVO01009427.1.p1  ORF type:complete len:180 (+),score=61.86 GHVO01009427.1:245-784(+)